MEPGPEGQEDGPCDQSSESPTASPQWSLARKARKTTVTSTMSDLNVAAMEPGPEGQEDLTGVSSPSWSPTSRNGAWPGRPGRQGHQRHREGQHNQPQWNLARKARKT